MINTCPHCGASLHEKASFCPSCTQSINNRTEPTPPKPILRRALLLGIGLLAVAGVVLGIWLHNRPVTVEGHGEVTYSDKDGSYQLLLSKGAGRFHPLAEVVTPCQLGQEYRMPCCFYINHQDSGENAAESFLEKVESVTAEFIQPADSVSPRTCTEPAANAYDPDAAMVSFLNFTARSDTADLVWTINMKSGDTIVLHQNHTSQPIETFNYRWGDFAMNTTEELQALIDRIERDIARTDIINVFLPPIVYEGGLEMTRDINLYGSTDGENRTTFTDTVKLTSQYNGLSYKDIDFVGAAGVGISATAGLHIIDCRFTGWKTAVLAYGKAWVNVAGSQFEKNDIGFHFNSTGESVTHAQYTGNRFIGNETAVLLEHVPRDVTLIFDECQFSENGKDIDNPCQQPIDVSSASFQ